MFTYVHGEVARTAQAATAATPTPRSLTPPLSGSSARGFGVSCAAQAPSLLTPKRRDVREAADRSGEGLLRTLACRGSAPASWYAADASIVTTPAFQEACTQTAPCSTAPCSPNSTTVNVWHAAGRRAFPHCGDLAHACCRRSDMQLTLRRTPCTARRGSPQKCSDRSPCAAPRRRACYYAAAGSTAGGLGAAATVRGLLRGRGPAAHVRQRISASPACWYSATSSLLQYAQAAPVWAPRLSARWPCCARARHARTYLPGPQAYGIRVLGALRVPRRCACATLVVELASCFQRLYRGKGSGEVLVPLHIYYDRAPTRAPPCDVVQN